MPFSEEPAAREARLVAAATILAIGTFVADLFLPLGVAGGAPYTVLVLLGLWSRRRWFLPILASAATVLTVVGGLLSPAGIAWMGIVNRVLTVLAIWAIAIVLLQYDRTRRALIRTRRDARAYLDIAQIVFVVLDPDGNIVLLNRKGGEILECDPAQVVGSNWFEVFLPRESREDVREVFDQLVRGQVEPVEYYENSVRTARGRERIIAWHNSVLRNEQGDIIGVLSSGEDITERRRAEEVTRRREALARIGQMAAVVAHEVKNPIAGVSGAIQVLEKRLPLSDEDRDVLRSIVERLDGLNRMSRDLLQFSRPRRPQPQPLALQQLLREAAHLIHGDPALAGTSVEIEGADPTVRGDAELLGTVFLNLFLNAAHAMDGKGTIRVALSLDERSCRVSVEDRGSGIPEEKREHIFEPFFTTKARGTGLGLAVARQVVEAHGGEIAAEFPEEGGTRFVVHLPNGG